MRQFSKGNYKLKGEFTKYNTHFQKRGNLTKKVKKTKHVKISDESTDENKKL